MYDVATYTPTPIPASVYVACPTPHCTAFGIQRLVYLPQVALGVVAVPQLRCQACRSVLALPLNPDLQETPMPKLHANRPPTDRHNPPAPATAAVVAPVESVVRSEPEPADLPAATVTVAAEANKATPRKTQTRKKAGGNS